MRAILTAVLLTAVVLAAELASADEKADAKKHFEAGLALFNSEDFRGAAVEFEESIRLYKTKSAIFNLANCYKGLKRYSESLASLKLLEGEFGSSIDAEMKKAIATIRQEIESTTGTLEVRVDKPGASIFVDGEIVGKSPMPVPVLLGPGYHEIKAEKEGAAAAQKVKLLSGEKKVIALKLASKEAAPAVVAPPKPQEKPEKPVVKKEEPAAPVEEPAPVEPEETGRKRSPVLLAVSVVGTAVTVGLGVAAGVFWGKTGSARDDYNSYLKSYGELDPGATSYDYTAEEERLFGELGDARDSVAVNNRAAVGLTVGGGVAAAASVVLWIFYAKSGEETADSGQGGQTAEPAPVSFAPAPGGVGVEF
jgi:tetratricopeptide (TPR) repeat protein